MPLSDSNHTMLPIDAALYLPISEATLREALDDTKELSALLPLLSPPEIASLFLLQCLPELGRRSRLRPERMLAEIISSCQHQVSTDGFDEFVSYAQAQLGQSSIEAGYQLVSTLQISFLDQDTVRKQTYFDANGQWDYQFQTHYRTTIGQHLVAPRANTGHRWLSAEQSRIYREFASDSDEHLHIQGYAGTGKSSLIKALLSMFENSEARILLVADTKQQLDAMAIDSTRMTHVYQCTFGEMAEMTIPQDLTAAGNLNMLRKDRTRATMPDETVIKLLGIHDCAQHNRQQIVMAVRATVFRFCKSTDQKFGMQHLPNRFISRFDLTTKNVIIHHAQELWQATLTPPSKELRPPIRDIHKVKWAALNHWPIPSNYTHVLIDECHNLPPAVDQVLSCSPQARLTLGDDYQNLQGRFIQQPSIIRQREMIHSVRSGHQIESIINPIISIHPSKTKIPFSGNSLNKLDIQYYAKATTPDEPAIILVNDIWGLLEWAQRLASQNINPVLMSDKKDLDMFAQDCIELKSGQRGARHGELFRFESWQDLSDSHHANPSFRRINQLLEKGYNYKNWQQTYRRFSLTDNRTHTLGVIENVRNLEFDTVMLAPDILSALGTMPRAAFSSSIYVAVTRARKRLIIPEGLRHWIEEISAEKGGACRVRESRQTYFS